MGIVDVVDATFSGEVETVTDRHVLVDFWAEWCGPCRMLAPVVQSISDSFADRIKVCKVNTDEAPSVSSRFQITNIPCCILFKDGKEIKRFLGYRSASAFSVELDTLIS